MLKSMHLFSLSLHVLIDRKYKILRATTYDNMRRAEAGEEKNDDEKRFQIYRRIASTLHNR